MSRVERAGDLRDERYRAIRFQRALAVEIAGEVAAEYQSHRGEEPSVRLAGLVDRRDVGMLERCGRHGLVPEALEEGRSAASGSAMTFRATSRSRLS